MQENRIKDFIMTRFKPEIIKSVDIAINEHNHQLDLLIIVFEPEAVGLGFDQVGEIIKFLDEYTREEGYGDMTELHFKYSTYHELENGDLTISFTFQPTIDS